MKPGSRHNIINLSDIADLATEIWASEDFDVGRPDTYFEKQLAFRLFLYLFCNCQSL